MGAIAVTATIYYSFRGKSYVKYCGDNGDANIAVGKIGWDEYDAVLTD
jgi:hypothetical protein